MKLKQPCQNIVEWNAFLELVGNYFKRRNIERPVIVELGIARNYQKRHYEQFMNAIHIGVDQKDMSDVAGENCTPDIMGDVLAIETFQALQERLGGREIDLLYIDLDCGYEPNASAYKKYAPLAKHIVAIHSIEVTNSGVQKLWQEILEEPSVSCKITIFSKLPETHDDYITRMGTGLIIKNE